MQHAWRLRYNKYQDKLVLPELDARYLLVLAKPCCAQHTYKHTNGGRLKAFQTRVMDSMGNAVRLRGLHTTIAELDGGIAHLIGLSEALSFTSWWGKRVGLHERWCGKSCRKMLGRTFGIVGVVWTGLRFPTFPPRKRKSHVEGWRPEGHPRVCGDDGPGLLAVAVAQAGVLDARESWMVLRVPLWKSRRTGQECEMMRRSLFRGAAITNVREARERHEGRSLQSATGTSPPSTTGPCSPTPCTSP